VRPPPDLRSVFTPAAESPARWSSQMRRHRISEEGGGVTGVEEEEGVEICWCAEIHQRHLCNPLVRRDPPTASVFPIIIRVCVTFDWLILRHLPQLSSCAIERSRGAGHGLKLPTREMGCGRSPCWIFLG